MIHHRQVRVGNGIEPYYYLAEHPSSIKPVYVHPTNKIFKHLVKVYDIYEPETIVMPLSFLLKSESINYKARCGESEKTKNYLEVVKNVLTHTNNKLFEKHDIFIGKSRIFPFLVKHLGKNVTEPLRTNTYGYLCHPQKMFSSEPNFLTFDGERTVEVVLPETVFDDGLYSDHIMIGHCINRLSFVVLPTYSSFVVPKSKVIDFLELFVWR